MHNSLQIIGMKIRLSRYIAMQPRIDGLVQDCSNSIADALELLPSCTKPSILPLLTGHRFWKATILGGLYRGILLITTVPCGPAQGSRFSYHNVWHLTVAQNIQKSTSLTFRGGYTSNWHICFWHKTGEGMLIKFACITQIRPELEILQCGTAFLEFKVDLGNISV